MSKNTLPSIYPHEIHDKRILIAALDWGMGHTTRLVSLMKPLKDQNNHLIFAGNTAQCDFIKAEFSDLEIVYLQGYEISLDGQKSTYWQLVFQGLKFVRALKAERNWLRKFLANHQIDLILSDNRYGFYHPSVRSVLITHQLNLQVPRFRKMVNKQVHRWIEKFDICWIPDTEARTYTGELTACNLQIPLVFIGVLNRFDKLDFPKVFDVLVILSGPEPERSNFKMRMIETYKNSPLSVAFVGCKVVDFQSFERPTTAELERLIGQSETVVSRAGYTTIMELSGLNKKAILYPTKGQYEQEYLAKFIKIPWIEFKD